MAGACVVAYSPQNQSPYYPVFSVFWALLHSLLDLLDGFSKFAFFKEGEGPVTVAIMIVRVIHLSLTTYLYCLCVELMHVKQES
jgi:hypothetical protein